MANERVWSDLQQAIFDDVKSGEGHTVVQARAGSGKTSSIIEALRYVPGGERTLLVAFNKSIAQELGERVPPGVRVSTLHGHGFGAVKRELGAVQVEEHKSRRLLGESFPNVDRTMRAAACKAVSMAKNQLLPAAGAEVEGSGSSNGALGQIECMIDSHWIGDFEKDEERRQCAELTLWLLEQAKDPKGTIDFDDMIWLPVVNNWSFFRNDRLFTDECQDLNRAQHEIVARSVKRDGRLCAVGDSRQCIPAGQFVSTPGGQTLVEDLREGDEVLAAKAGVLVARKILRKTKTSKEMAYEFDLGEHGSFRATAEHVLFAALDDPKGAFCYLMYRPDLGFRIGVSRTVGRRGKNFAVRTQQERAERLWVLEWRETYNECAEIEAHLAYRFGVPREPFVPRDNMWSGCVEATARLFEKFGQNGRRVLDAYELDFDRPNYFAKASGRGCIAVNLLIGTKDGHRVEVESSLVSSSSAHRLEMLPTHRGTYRRRSCFWSLRDARQMAEVLAQALGGYVAESLSGVADKCRRTFAVPARSVNVGMHVPIAHEDGTIHSTPVLARRMVPVGECYDLEVEDLGTFVVNGVVVHNSIYQFRGADRSSMDRIRRMFDAKELPLSITYRCPKKVVELVQSIVPDFRAPDSAPEGIVEDCDRDRMMAGAKPGDFILSRTNAPLIKLCLEFLKQNRRAIVMGRDVGKGLVSLIEKSKANTVDELEGWVNDWATRETRKLLSRNPEANIDPLHDRRDCLLALSDGAGSVVEVRARVDKLFGEGDPLDRIALSTTHKAKGLERDRVWMLRDTFLRFKSVEEENIFYVAATRAHEELYLVRGGS